MYIKKVEGARTARLPDGSMMSRSDLPPANTRRWVASRKAAVVRGVACGLISRTDAIKKYSLSEEEFESWCRAVLLLGERGLKSKGLEELRKPELLRPEKQL